MAENSEVIQHSVTQGDYAERPDRNGAVLNFWLPNQGPGIVAGLPPHPGPYWSFKRDEVLRSTMYFESMWASAVYVAATKMASLSFKVKGPGLRARRSRDLLLSADIDGWVSFLSKHLRDYLTTDNGAFIEIVRASPDPGSRILGLMHLDSRRCTRTGDPDVPVIYRDRRNRYHELQDYQVIALSDMADPGDLWYGVGYCAASRAYNAIYNLSVLETYVGEKMAGRKPLAVHFVNNVSLAQVENAVLQAEQKASAKGYVSYLGAVIIPNIDPTSTPQVATLDLAGLPDGFDADQERRNVHLIYANAIGLDPQDIDPQSLASKAMGTGAQSRVIDDKASGKGLVAWRQMFTHALNERVFPEDVSFAFSELDYRDRIQVSEIEARRTTTMSERIKAGIINPMQALQLMVDADELPQEFLPTDDQTPIEELGSDDNPRVERVGSGEDNPTHGKGPSLEFINPAEAKKPDSNFGAKKPKPQKDGPAPQKEKSLFTDKDFAGAAVLLKELSKV